MSFLISSFLGSNPEDEVTVWQAHTHHQQAIGAATRAPKGLTGGHTSRLAEGRAARAASGQRVVDLTQRAHGHLQLLAVDGARAIGVEQVKGFPDLLPLLLGQLDRHYRTDGEG